MRDISKTCTCNLHGQNVLSAQMLEVSLLIIGVGGIEWDAWSKAKRLNRAKLATSSPLPPPRPRPRPPRTRMFYSRYRVGTLCTRSYGGSTAIGDGKNCSSGKANIDHTWHKSCEKRCEKSTRDFVWSIYVCNG